MPRPVQTPLPLAELQSRVQAVIATHDTAARPQVLRALRPAAHAPKDAMLDIYCNAYRSRLSEILEQDLPALVHYLGEELFSHFAAGYIEAHPSDMRNARWYSRHAAIFLARNKPFSKWPQMAELAAIELALADAFDAAEANPVTIEDLTATPPEAWADLTFHMHPSLRRINTTTNAVDLWTALQSTDDPPQTKVLGTPQPLLVWRQDAQSRLRALTPAEARGLDALSSGANFAAACEAMCHSQYDEQDPTDAGTAVTLLAGWVAAGLLIAS